MAASPLGTCEASEPSARVHGDAPPNLSTDEHNNHSPLEWTCLEELQTAVRVVVELCQVWGENKERAG